MNKSLIFRLLATLEQKGYVEKAGRSGKYRLGLWSYEMGQKILSRMGVLSTAKPIMERLARQCDEAVYLAVPRNQEVLLLDMVDTSQQVAIKPLVGNTYPLARTSAGRILLTFRSTQAELSADAPSLPGEELAFVKHQGASIEVGGFGDGVASLAVPLFNAQREVLGCLCILGPEYRFGSERMECELLPRLQETGKVVSSKLGYLGHHLTD